MELHDEIAERAVIRTLSEASTIDVARARLLFEREGVTERDFASPPLAEAFWAVAKLVCAGTPADLLSIWPKLKTSANVERAGGWKWATELFVGSGDAATYEGGFGSYCATLRDLATRRKMLAAGLAIIGRAKDADSTPAEVLLKASQHLASLSRSGDDLRRLDQVLHSVGQEFDSVQRGEAVPLFPTGIDCVDELIGGLQATLIAIGAYPGVGKSGLEARIVKNLARSGVNVGIFSLEDPAEWMPWRYLADSSRVAQFLLQYRKLNDEQAVKAAEAFADVATFADRVFVDDRPGLDIAEIMLSARNMIINKGCRVIFVDHLGEIRWRGGRSDRDLQIADGLSELRSLSKMGVAVVVISHLKRIEENRPPRMSDFADASAVERKARIALALSREEGDTALSVHVLKHTKGRGVGRLVRLKFDGVSAMPTNEEDDSPVTKPEPKKKSKKKTDEAPEVDKPAPPTQAEF